MAEKNRNAKGNLVLEIQLPVLPSVPPRVHHAPAPHCTCENQSSLRYSHTDFLLAAPASVSKTREPNAS
jgi:hypothetical protein